MAANSTGCATAACLSNQRLIHQAREPSGAVLCGHVVCCSAAAAADSSGRSRTAGDWHRQPCSMYGLCWQRCSKSGCRNTLPGCQQLARHMHMGCVSRTPHNVVGRCTPSHCSSLSVVTYNAWQHCTARLGILSRSVSALAAAAGNVCLAFLLFYLSRIPAGVGARGAGVWMVVLLGRGRGGGGLLLH